MKFCQFLIATTGLCLLAACATNQHSQTQAQNTKRNVETLIADESIELQAVKKIFNNDKLWNNSEIEVVSFNKTLLLIGQTPTRSLKLKAKQLAESIPDVKKVFNEIRVAAPTSSLTYLSDVTITSKVKAVLMSSDDVDSSKIKVITEDGEVFLMGLVSQKEAQKAIDITRKTSGVKRVIQAFEIVR